MAIVHREQYCVDGSGCAIPTFIGWDGELVDVRTEHFVWKSEKFRKEGFKSAYSDRLYEQDSSKFRASVAAVWPSMPERQFFHCVEPEDVNKFLNLYMSREVTLTAIMMGYNKSTDYPFWIFFWEE